MAQSTTRSFPPMRKARSTWQWSAKLFAPTNATNWGRGVQIETNLAVCRLGCHATFQSQPKLIFQKFQRPCRIGKRHRSLDEPLTPCFDNHGEWRVAWQGKAVSGPSRPTVWESEVTIVLGKPGTCNKSVACCDVLGPPSSGKPVLCWWRCPGKIRSWYLRSHITRRCRLHLLTVWDGMNDLSHASGTAKISLATSQTTLESTSRTNMQKFESQMTVSIREMMCKGLFLGGTTRPIWTAFVSLRVWQGRWGLCHTCYHEKCKPKKQNRGKWGHLFFMWKSLVCRWRVVELFSYLTETNALLLHAKIEASLRPLLLRDNSPRASRISC